MQPDEYATEKMTQLFLHQCHEDGRVSDEELAELSIYRDGCSYAKPDTLVRFADFVTLVQVDTGWPIEDVRRTLALHLKSKQLTVQHLEIYLNYPTWTETELAAVFNLTQPQVSERLSAVRRAWHGLRLDATGAYGVPALKDMLRIELSADSDDRLDVDEIIKF
jgi:hypothetical protein